MTPHFIGIGAQKCATTWLYDLLELHPSTQLSSEKEIHFFSQFYEYGFQWYERYFNDASSSDQTSLFGEFSTSYFSDLDAPARIKQAYPNTKLLLMLRDPVERLISNHKHEIRIGHFTGPDFSVEAGIKNNPSYIHQGLYGTHLKRWYEYFDKEQIHIVFFDEVKSNPQLVEQELYKFLAIEQQTHHNLLEKSNSSYVYRYGILEQVRKSVIGILKKLNFEKTYRTIVKRSGLQSLYRGINRANPSNVVPPIKTETIALLSELFKPEISQLELLTGKDLSNWKNMQ